MPSRNPVGEGVDIYASVPANFDEALEANFVGGWGDTSALQPFCTVSIFVQMDCFEMWVVNPRYPVTLMIVACIA